jgi:tetratricopeptide (TPR) repeat protein
LRKLFALVLVPAAILVGGALAFQALREQQYRTLLAQGDAAAREGRTFSAVEAYSGAIALRPDSMLAHLRRGETYQHRGDLDAATRDFRRAADLDRTATRPLEALGDVLYQRGRFKRAADVYESRLRLDDRSSGADRMTYKLALARYRDGNRRGAMAALDQTIRLNDRLADAHYLRGVCLRDEGRLPDAIAPLERALALSPGLIPAREELVDVYGLLGKHADQLEQLQLLAGLDRERVERHVDVGLAHARAGRGELAVLALGNALERMPAQPLIYGALGRVWLELSDVRDDAPNKALEALERVATAPAATSDVLTLYGRALWRLNRAVDAERALQQAMQRFPVDPEAFLLYSRIAQAKNDPAAAERALAAYRALVGTS